MNLKHEIPFAKISGFQSVKILLFIGFLLASPSSYSQSRTKLEQQRDKINADIRYTNELIKKAQESRANALDELNLIDQKINLRNKLITSINSEIRSINRSIEKNEDFIEALKKDLKNLRTEYANLIYYAYKNRNGYDQLMFIFASDDFYQAIRRARYVKEISNHRKNQGALIEQTQVEIERSNQELVSQKEEKLKLAADENDQKNQLAADRKQLDRSIANLQQNEGELKKKLKQAEKERIKLNKEIEKLIAAEMKKEKGGSINFDLTPEEKLTSGNFEKNKGKLPWPVTRGVITGRFGKHPHPALPGIEMTNNGINISTDKGAEVRTIFSGTVSGIIAIPGAGQAVVVKHGGYRTVYSGLREIFVSKDQNLDAKQMIGTLLFDEAGHSESHLEVWKISSNGMQKLDPAQWLAN